MACPKSQLDLQQVEPVHRSLATDDESIVAVVDPKHPILDVNVAPVLLQLAKAENVGGQLRDEVHPMSAPHLRE